MPKALLLTTLVAALTSQAAVTNWTNPTGGFWNAATNLSPNTWPGASDDVLITAVGNYTVTLDVHPTAASLTLGGISRSQTLSYTGFIPTLNGDSARFPVRTRVADERRQRSAGAG